MAAVYMCWLWASCAPIMSSTAAPSLDFSSAGISFPACWNDPVARELALGLRKQNATVVANGGPHSGGMMTGHGREDERIAALFGGGRLP